MLFRPATLFAAALALSLALSATSVRAQSQTESAQPRLVLVDGRTFQGRVELVPALRGEEPYLLLDRSQRFRPTQVQRFRTPEGVFAPRQVFARGHDATQGSFDVLLLKRTRDARLDLFSPVTDVSDQPKVGYGYFSEGEGPVREASYSNLMEVFQNDDRARRIMKRRNVYRAAAVTLVTVGLVWMIYDSDKLFDELRAAQRGGKRLEFEDTLLPGGAFVVAATVPFAFSLTSKRRAIRAYNSGE